MPPGDACQKVLIHCLHNALLPATMIQSESESLDTLSIITEAIASGFKATGIVPFDAERALVERVPVIDATPSPRSSQASWKPQTPKTLPEIKKQGELV